MVGQIVHCTKGSGWNPARLSSLRGCICLWEGASFLDSHKGAICLPNHRHWGAALGQGAPLPQLHKSCCLGWQCACSMFTVSQASTGLHGHKFSLYLQNSFVSSNCTHVHTPRETQLQAIDNSGGQGAVAQVSLNPVLHPDTAYARTGLLW